jgi:hypothetical protein
MKHTEKLKLARRMSGKQKGAFQSEAWEARKKARSARVKRKMGVSKTKLKGRKDVTG